MPFDQFRLRNNRLSQAFSGMMHCGVPIGPVDSCINRDALAPKDVRFRLRVDHANDQPFRPLGPALVARNPGIHPLDSLVDRRKLQPLAAPID